MLQRELQGELVAFRAQAADDAHRDIGEIGLPAERLPREHVRDITSMNGMSTAARASRMQRWYGCSGGIDDDEIDALAPRLLDPVDQLGFRMLWKVASRAPPDGPVRRAGR